MSLCLAYTQSRAPSNVESRFILGRILHFETINSNKKVSFYGTLATINTMKMEHAVVEGLAAVLTMIIQ